MNINNNNSNTLDCSYISISFRKATKNDDRKTELEALSAYVEPIPSFVPNLTQYSNLQNVYIHLDEKIQSIELSHPTLKHLILSTKTISKLFIKKFDLKNLITVKFKDFKGLTIESYTPSLGLKEVSVSAGAEQSPLSGKVWEIIKQSSITNLILHSILPPDTLCLDNNNLTQLIITNLNAIQPPSGVKKHKLIINAPNLRPPCLIKGSFTDVKINSYRLPYVTVRLPNMDLNNNNLSPNTSLWINKDD